MSRAEADANTPVPLVWTVKLWIWAERYGTVDELVEGVQSVFHVYDVGTFERV